jgi:hypothetical protein
MAKDKQLHLFEVTSRINTFTLYEYRPVRDYFTICPPNTLGESMRHKPNVKGSFKLHVHSYEYNNFPVSWYFRGKERPCLENWQSDMDTLFEQAIRNYKEEKANRCTGETERAILEYFFEEEGKALLQYLGQAQGVTSFMTELKLPETNNLGTLESAEGEKDFHIVRRPDDEVSDVSTDEEIGRGSFSTWPFPDDTLLPFGVYSNFLHPNEEKETILKEQKEMEIVIDRNNPGDWMRICMKEMKSIPPN